MAWKKVIVSGSVASLSEVSASVGFKGNLVGAVTGNATTATTATQVGNSLTVDDSTIQLNSGTTYDGAAARTISVKNSGITLAKIANQANNTVLGNVSGGAAAPADSCRSPAGAPSPPRLPRCPPSPSRSSRSAWPPSSSWPSCGAH